jgi:hypothetical protein
MFDLQPIPYCDIVQAGLQGDIPVIQSVFFFGLFNSAASN